MNKRNKHDELSKIFLAQDVGGCKRISLGEIIKQVPYYEENTMSYADELEQRGIQKGRHCKT